MFRPVRLACVSIDVCEFFVSINMIRIVAGAIHFLKNDYLLIYRDMNREDQQRNVLMCIQKIDFVVGLSNLDAGGGMLGLVSVLDFGG